MVQLSQLIHSQELAIIYMDQLLVLNQLFQMEKFKHQVKQAQVHLQALHNQPKVQ